ncbi:MAG: VIT1/CCC1 transporter family protein [Candidatus Odinarchaeia archaeon]
MGNDEDSHNDREEKDSFRRRIKTYFEITGVGEIARRYFVMNAFDGALTTLGIILGSFASGAIDPVFIIGAGLGGSIAMAISGFTGAYMAEKAERERDLKNLEHALCSDLKNSIHERAKNFASIFVAIVDGTAPFLASMLSLLPFFFAQAGWIPSIVAMYTSIGIIMAMLFLLGLFLGRISKVNLIVSGLKMVFAGLLVALISLLLAIL